MSTLVRYTAITLAILLGATAAHAGDNDDDMCPPLTGPSDKKLKLEIGEYHLSLTNKKPICIVMGHSVKVKIKTPGNSVTIEPGDVTAGQKAGSPFEITGVNSGEESDDGKYLILTAKPFEYDPGDDSDCGDGSEYECGKFWIKVAGVGEFDPRVRVVEGGIEMRLHQNILWETLNDLGLTPQEAMTALNWQGDGEE